ncbi:MAG: TatD family hydrolase [Paramuribaculum sp.]|nr:TatD family hydrolase [Paramuribaculum sp.]MDE6323182.1 TatD family hydrolase [Paramuribaculum sp.]MDE6489131.1 TatD family hydrolase [Paramuribaculum sp.]
MNCVPGEDMPSGYIYSAGIHPWNAAEGDLRQLEQMLRHPDVKAVGEAGIDLLKGPPADVQIDVFRRQVALSEQSGKPVVVHCVKALQGLMALRSELKPVQPWIYHGFRGKPQMARQLVNAGMFVSFGSKFNEESVREIPSDRLLIETDDSEFQIEAVAALVASALKKSVGEVIRLCSSNLSRILDL